MNPLVPGDPVSLFVLTGGKVADGVVLETPTSLGTPLTFEPGFWAATPKVLHTRWFFSYASEGRFWQRVVLH